VGVMKLRLLYGVAPFSGHPVTVGISSCL